MKLFFISDIHGSIDCLNTALEKFKEENADYIVILGDIMYHGPRNPLPQGYNPKAVADKLNEFKDRIIAVRGNCDAEVDQMLLKFPILSDFATIFYEGIRIFASHGHNFNLQNLPDMSSGDVFIQGHTHIPVADKANDIYILNPGSITLPKENNPQSFAVMEKGDFMIKDFAGGIIKQIKI